MTVLGIFMLFFAARIVSWFSTDPEILHWGTSCLRILGIGYPIYAVGMVIVQSLNGAGDTRTPSLLNFVCFWIIQIPIAYWMSTDLNFGPNGVFTAIIVSEFFLTISAVLVFRTGKWLQQEV